MFDHIYTNAGLRELFFVFAVGKNSIIEIFVDAEVMCIVKTSFMVSVAEAVKLDFF